MLRKSLRTSAFRRLRLPLRQFLEELAKRMRPWKKRAGRGKQRAFARMREAARNPPPSLPMDNKVTEPGGSVPALLCLPLSGSSRTWERWQVPGPGGPWCQSAATLDCSLRYRLSSTVALCNACCQKIATSERVPPSPKTPGLFPARHHFGSSCVLLGQDGAGAPAPTALKADHGWIAGSFEAVCFTLLDRRSLFPAFQTLSHAHLPWTWPDPIQRWSTWRCSTLMRLGSFRCLRCISWCPSRMTRQPNSAVLKS
eukprot:867832-Amphidinium_carterae.1